MKKLLAIALTIAMLCVCAISVSAAETTLPDSDGTTWWVNHTPGVELTTEGVEITFHVKVYDTATAENVWGPLWIVYNGDEAKVNGNGFKEYWVGRGDAWGWGQAPSFGLDAAALDGRFPELMTQAGITQTATFAEGFDWGVYQTTLKAGTDVKMTAKLVDGKVTVVIDLAGVATTTSFPVDTSKPVYLSLFGDQAKLTDIKVITPDPVTPDEPSKTGDASMIVAASVVAVLSAAGVALVLKKKEF